MTDKLYLNAMYLKGFDAKITKMEGNNVVLDKTAFYPAGGGQPSDTGRLKVNGKEFRVADVKKSGDDILHVMESVEGLSAGDLVDGAIDWEKRYAYMKYHTTIHIIDGIVTRMYAGKGFSTGSQIYQDRARVDFDMAELTRELAQKIIDDSNAVARQGRKIIVREVGRDEALNMPNLVRTEPGRELIKKLDVVRIVEIEGLDMQMDGGLHVENSKEIGRIVLSDFSNKGSHHKRVEVRLERLTAPS